MGARGSCLIKQATVPSVEATATTVEAKAPAVEADMEPVKCTVAADPAVDATEALEEESVATTAVDLGAYQEALARCAQLRITRQELLQAKTEVLATIARFSPAFEDLEESQSSDSGEDEDEDADQHGEDHEGCISHEQASVDLLTYENVLAEQEELEDEVEMLRETLDKAAAMIAGIVDKSQQLSEHLEEVEIQIQLPAKPTFNVISDTSSDDAAPAQVCNVTSYSMKPEQEDLKLPALNFLAVPGTSGSQASSSTATPRSEKSSESRMASARSESACWCERLPGESASLPVKAPACGG